MANRAACAVTCLILVWAMIPSGGAVADEGLFREVRSELIRKMRGEDVPGAAVVLVDGQDIIYAQGVGRINADGGELIGSHTPFPAGDLTKLITAIAVLQQVDAARMGLDEPITRYLPQLEITARFAFEAAPTIRQLLTHHSGLPNNFHGGSYQRVPPETVPAFESVFLAQPPGLVYAYSNLSFVLLGQALEAVTGQPYTTYVSDKVLAPLGMADSGFSPSDDMALPHDTRENPLAPIYARDLPALGLIASIHDIGKLAAWFLAEETAPVLPRRWVDEMARLQNGDVPLDVDNRIGLVWQLTNTGRHNAELVLRVNSFLTHYRGILLITPTEGIAVAIMASSENAGQMVIDVGETALDATLQAQRGIPRPPEEIPLAERVELPATIEPQDLLERYNTPLGEVVFTTEDGEIEMAALGRLFGLKRRPDGWHELSFRLFGVIDLRFSVLAEILMRAGRIDGREVLLAHFRGYNYLFGAAIGSGEPIPDPQRWSGRYRLANPGVLSEAMNINEIDLEAGEDRVHVNYELRHILRVTPRLPALHLGRMRFYIPGLGTNMGDEFSLHDVGGERMLRYSNWVFVRQ